MAWPKRRSSRGRDDIKDNPRQPSSSSYHHHPQHPPCPQMQPQDPQPSAQQCPQHPNPSSPTAAGPPPSYRYSAAQFAPQPGVQYYARYDLSTFKFGTAEQAPASPSSSSHHHTDSVSSRKSSDERDLQLANTDITPRPSVFDNSRVHQAPSGSHPSQTPGEPPSPVVLTDRLHDTQLESRGRRDTDTDTYGASISVTSFSSRDDSRASGTASRTSSSPLQSSQSVPIDSDFSDEHDHRLPLPITSSINSSSPERNTGTPDYYRSYSHDSFTESEDMYTDSDSDSGSANDDGDDASARDRMGRMTLGPVQYDDSYSDHERFFNAQLYRSQRNDSMGWEERRRYFLSETSINRELASQGQASSDVPPPPPSAPMPGAAITSRPDPAELTRELIPSGAFEAPGFGTGRRSGDMTMTSGRDRVNSVGTLRRASRSLDNNIFSPDASAPVCGGSGNGGNWSTIDPRLPSGAQSGVPGGGGFTGIIQAPSTTAVSSTTQSGATSSSAMDGFDAGWLNLAQGIISVDQNDVADFVRQPTGASTTTAVTAKGSAGPGKAGSGNEEGDGKSKKKWYSMWFTGGHKEEPRNMNTAPAAANVAGGRRFSAASVIVDSFGRQLVQWDSTNYGVRRKEWTFKRERADRLRGAGGGEVDPLVASRFSGDGAHPVPPRYQKPPPLAGFTTIHDSTAEPPRNQEYLDTLREVDEAERVRIRAKEIEENEREREKRLKSATGMWKGMALNSQELWRNELVGRFKVDRKAVRSQTSDMTKPPQQRLMVNHFRDGFIKVPGVGPPITIHKHSRAAAFSLSRHYRPRAPTPPLVQAPLPLSSDDSSNPASTNDVHKPAIPKPHTAAPQPRKGSMILLAPLRVQLSFTNTATTRKLADHGLLKDTNTILTPMVVNDRHREKERDRERRRDGRRDHERRKEKESDKKKAKQIKVQQKEDKRRKKEDELGMKKIEKGKSKPDLTHAHNSSGGSAGSVGTGCSAVAPASASPASGSPPVAPPLVKSKSTSTTNSTTAVASNSTSASGSASANVSTTKLAYLPATQATSQPSPAPLSNPSGLQSGSSATDDYGFQAITPRRPRRRKKVTDPLEYMSSDEEEEEEGHRSDGPPPTRTPHNEAFGMIDASFLELRRALVERSQQYQAASEAERGGMMKRLLSRNKASNPDLAGPNPAYLESNFDPPWLTLPSRAKLEEQQRVVENLNESFKDVGLLPSGKKKKRAWRPKRTENRDIPMILADIPDDCLFMLIPLWPGETDHAHVKNSTPERERPAIPVQDREYLLVHYRSASAEVLQKLTEAGQVPGRSGLAHEAYIRRQAERIKGEGGLNDDRSVLLTSFNVVAKLVTYGQLTGSGIRRPDEGLAITGPLDLAYEQLPRTTRKFPYEGTSWMIATCHSRESGFEFIPDGFAKFGLCHEIPADPKEVPEMKGVEEDELDPTLVMTPIGRAAMEMIWLGCLAVTSFGPSFDVRHK